MYKLIMIDYKMPTPNGAETAAMILNFLIQQQQADSSRPYVVSISNFNDSSTIKEKCMSAGVDEFVSKPIFKIGIYRLLVQA